MNSHAASTSLPLTSALRLCQQEMAAAGTERTDDDTAAAVHMSTDAELQATKDMLTELKGAYAVSLLLQLKHYIRTVYRLDSERIANFSPFGVDAAANALQMCTVGLFL